VVAIAVSSEEEWTNMCDAMGNPSWIREPRFSDPVTRYSNHDALDKLIEAWTCQKDKHDVVQVLQKAGVASAPVLLSSELLSDPHLEHRGFIQEITHPVTGTYKQQGFPAKFSETPVRIRMPAPTLGQHNEYVLTKLLGLTTDEIRQLAEEKVIGTKPMGWPYSEDAGEQDKRLLVGDQGSGVRKALEKQKDVDEEEGMD
jgi:crotonobetainyl-CoA:carnitine CoA-transferase CaiB-like acyl-CoA transferase